MAKRAIYEIDAGGNHHAAVRIGKGDETLVVSLKNGVASAVIVPTRVLRAALTTEGE